MEGGIYIPVKRFLHCRVHMYESLPQSRNIMVESKISIITYFNRYN